MNLTNFRKLYTKGAAQARFEVREAFETAHHKASVFGLLPATGHRLPRTLADLEAHPLVEEVSDERKWGDGIWIYLVPGVRREQCDYVHCVHEDTVAGCCDAFREVWVGCDCDDCLASAGLDTEETAKLNAVAYGADADELLGLTFDDWPECPTCEYSGVPIVLGDLGTTTWHRCRACGNVFEV